MTNEEKILELLERMDKRSGHQEKSSQRAMLERIEELEADVSVLKMAVRSLAEEMKELKKAR